MRRLLALVLVPALWPAAAAASLGELPFTSQPRRAVSTCLRATGAPGGLAQLGPLTRRDSATDVLRVGGAAASRTARVRLGPLFECAAVAEAGGAAVVAGSSPLRAAGVVRAAVRDPGGAFGAPVRIGAGAQTGGPPAAAVSPAGDVVVAWAQRRRTRLRIVAARRPAAGRFGAPEALTAWARSPEEEWATVTAAVDPSGGSMVAWARPLDHGDGERRRFELASAPAGGAFAAPQRLGPVVDDAGAPELAVADDGWALAAAPGTFGTRVYERPPGAAAFTAVRSAEPLEGGEAAIAVRPGGGAVVATWRGAWSAPAVTVRPGPGALPVPRVLRVPGLASTFGGAEAILVFLPGRLPAPPLDQGNLRIRAAVASDGRALITWVTQAGPADDWVQRAFAATGDLDHGFGPSVALGSPLRSVNGVAALPLEDGRLAAAWTDNKTDRDFGFPFAGSAGRRHIAIEGAEPLAQPAAPAARLRVRSGQRLYADQPLVATLRCDAACDARVVARERGRVVATADASLRGAGTARVRIRRGFRAGSTWRRTVRLAARVSAPGATPLAVARATARVRARPVPPFPPVLGATARRSGRAIVVSWRTPFAARRVTFAVRAKPARNREFRSDADMAVDGVKGKGRTRFAVRLRPRHPARVRWVELQAIARDPPYRTRRVLIPVSG